jgi:hypothetical protein
MSVKWVEVLELVVELKMGLVFETSLMTAAEMELPWFQLVITLRLRLALSRRGQRVESHKKKQFLQSNIIHHECHTQKTGQPKQKHAAPVREL